MALEVFEWPARKPRLQNDLLLVSTAVPPDADRKRARALIRHAVTDALTQTLGMAASRIEIDSAPGMTPRLRLPGFSHAGLSITHERGLSLAAVHLEGAVGVDVTRVEEMPDWEVVAHDYLGPEVARSLSATPTSQRAGQFARHWCEREATLKCHGLSLREWAPDDITECAVFTLELPASMMGALAILKR